MAPIPWTQHINFASALLLHSCITVLLKEALNLVEILRRFFVAFLSGRRKRPHHSIRTSVVLDAYTSILSNDRDGELAELYFTNTGFILLAISLASSIAMNLLLSDLILDAIVASTFGVAFLASLVSNGKHITAPILALRRAGRFIWADTPFVNFFSLIYIATVLHGRSMLRLQDYVTFRCIAILELIFMKANLAASSQEVQVDLLKRLIASEWVIVKAETNGGLFGRSVPIIDRKDMVPFQTQQRLSVMFWKTSIGFHEGCLQGSHGPAACPLPEKGYYVSGKCWNVYRLSNEVMIIADCFARTPQKTVWLRFLTKAHGVLLRRLGKQRVIYLLRMLNAKNSEEEALWHTNINLVTGVSQKWLEEEFRPVETQKLCLIAGGQKAG